MFLKAGNQVQDLLSCVIEELQKENELADEYEKLLASAQIPFEGGVYTLSQLTPFKSDPDDARRLAAWKAEGNWYKENQAKLDDLYDQLVHLRDKMGKKLGYEGYTTLGYYRHGPQLLHQGRCREVSQGGCEVFGACGGQHLSRAGEAFGQRISYELCR